MGNNSLFSKIVFFIGVLLIGALLISKYGKHKTEISSTQEKLAQAQAVFQPKPAKASVDPELRIIPAAPSHLDPEEQKKWTILREIMRSKNDNDPRLDTALRGLSMAFHNELFHQYQALPKESRNERGLITFLVARDIKGPQDLAFLQSVYDESPCMSLEDCSTVGHGGDPHLSGLDQTSANYPQLAALYQLEKQINEGNKAFSDNDMKDRLKQLLDRAAQFPVPMVSRKAESIRASHPLLF